MYPSVRDRYITVFSFLSVALSAIALVLIPTPGEPWSGLYEPYAPVWGLLIISAVLTLWRIERGAFSWPLLVGWGLLFGLTIGALSVQWGWVYGHHDPWSHYGNIRFRVFDTSRNPYPAFHIWNIQVGNLLNVPGTTVLRYSAVLAAAIGVLGLGILLRTLPISTRGTQRAFVAGIPAVFLNFIPRPFTLGWPLVMIIAWALFTPLARRQAIALLIFLGVGLTAIHPQVPFLASALLLATFLVQLFAPRLPRSYNGIEIPFAARRTASLIGVYAIVVSFYFFVLSDFGERVVDKAFELVTARGDTSINTPSDDTFRSDTPSTQPSSTETPTDAGSPESTATQSPPTETPTDAGSSGSATGDGSTDQSQGVPVAGGVGRRTSKVSQLAKVVRNPSLLPELLARISYILVLGGLVTLSVIERLRERQLSSTAAVVFVAAGLYGVFYIFADLVLNNVLVGSMRIVRMLPLILAPGIAFALRHQVGRDRYVGFVLALLVLTSGIAVAYPSDFTGGTVKAATDQQVAGVDWVGTHAHNQSITGTGMTFWILEGRFDTARMLELAPTNNPPKGYVTRRVGFSWQVRNPSGLIVVDGFSRAQASQEVAESSDTTPLRDLETMPIRHGKIYTNGGTKIYGNHTVAGG